MPRWPSFGVSRLAAPAALLLIVHIALAPRDAGAQRSERARRWSLELLGGSALSAPTPLHIRQRGFPEIALLAAHYDTRPLRDAPYYMYRGGRWSDDGRHAWELELLHHKLYLRDPPPDVQHFEVTHGYNMLFVNRATRFSGTTVRLGAGPVIAHPETVVRGRSLAVDRGPLHAGYYLSGAAAQLAVGRRIALPAHLFLALEAKATAAAARVPVAEGSATVPNAAAHALIGMGAAF